MFICRSPWRENIRRRAKLAVAVRLSRRLALDGPARRRGKGVKSPFDRIEQPREEYRLRG